MQILPTSLVFLLTKVGVSEKKFGKGRKANGLCQENL